jgi:hypothetical protein
MKKLGLDPAGLGKFIASLHKLAVASGVSPENLAFLIREISELSEGQRMSIPETRRFLQQLDVKKKTLTKQVADLVKRKESLHVEINLRALEHSASNETLSEFARIRKRLDEHGLSLTNLSEFVSLIYFAKEQGYTPSALVSILSDLKFKQENRKEVEAETERLLDTKRSLQDRVLALEQELSGVQQKLKAAEELKKLGFDLKELEELSGVIRTIAKIRNIDVSAVKNQLLSDIQGYYANDQELRKRIRILENLLQEKEEKFNLLESDYRNEKAILENAKNLIAAGVDQGWLEKIRDVAEAYGTDIDSLAGELSTRQGLKASIEELVKTKKALEEEERLLRQKVVAVEDQRLRTLSLINNLIVNAPRSVSSQRQPGSQTQQENVRQINELNELIKAANGESIDIKEFMISSKKAIDIMRVKLPKDSPARVVLKHALLALRYELDHSKG